MVNKIKWNGHLQQEALDILSFQGGMVVCPTILGYIILTSDKEGLERTFDAKKRSRNKPGVIICGSMEQLKSLAEINPEIEELYQDHWNTNVPLGCTLPWKKEALDNLPDNGINELMMDTRNTSCFIIRPGIPCQLIVDELWKKHGKISFASSANISGESNMGKVENIGERIEELSDLIIAANDYIQSAQPYDMKGTRYEQSVMVSMVDDHGTLVPEQKGNKNISPCPTLIRKGFGINNTLVKLSDIFSSWQYKDGGCY